jgi:4-hydroxyacetophenone monooxygenase
MSEGTGNNVITESDAFLEDVLRHASIPALMAVLSHIQGNIKNWDNGVRPAAASFGPTDEDGLTDHQRHEVHAEALAVLRDYRDRGCPAPAPLDGDTLLRLMRLVAGDAVPEVHLPMLLADAGLDIGPIRSRDWPAPLRQKAGNFAVAIVGAGMSGLLMAIRLQEVGIPYIIIEKNSDVGGTWLVNSFPGCRVDVANSFYSYSFERDREWPHHFSERDSIFAYFRSVAEKYDIIGNVQFETEVTGASWSQERSMWEIDIRRSDGSFEKIMARAFIPAVGQLSRPKIPAFPGQSGFRGTTCHTGAYDRSISLDGKRVAIIGTAASAIQAIPEIAAKADHLFVVQRTAHWLLPVPHYHAAISPGMQWLLTHLPFYASWYRARYAARSLHGLRIVARIDPSWPHQERSVSAINDDIRERLTRYLENEMRDRPDMLERLVPHYPPFATRIMPNDGSYLQALKRENVELVTSDIVSLDDSGISMSDGSHLDVDVIIYASGFEATKYLYPMRIEGRNGAILNDVWGDEGRAYLGITVPAFPNMFMLFGPGTALFNVIFASECHARYIVDALQSMIENDWRSIECRTEVYEDYTRRFRDEVERLAMSSSQVTSWYKSATGTVVANMPFDIGDYWNWTLRADLADFTIEYGKSDRP